MDVAHVVLEPTSQLGVHLAPISHVLHAQRDSISPIVNTRIVSVAPLANTNPQQDRVAAEHVV